MKIILACFLTLFLTACDEDAAAVPQAPVYVDYQVLDKSFTGGQEGSGVGMSLSGHMVFTDTSTRDSFKLLLKNRDDNSVFTSVVDITTYSNIKVGDCLKYRRTSWRDVFQADEGPCPK